MKYTQQHLNSDLSAGVSSFNKGDFKSASSFFGRALHFFPKHPDGLRLQGITYGRMGNLKEALVCLKRAVKIAPKDAEAHHALGSFQAQMGKSKDALQSFRKAVALAGNRSGLHNDLGVFLSQQNRFEEAITAYRKAVALDNNNIKALENLANDLIRTKQYSEARDCYQSVVDAVPDNFHAVNGLALALVALRELDAAIEVYLKLLKSSDKDINLLVKLGDLYRRVGDYELSKQYLNRALDIESDNKAALVSLAFTHKKLGNYSDSSRLAEQVVEIDPEFALAHRSLGTSYLVQGELEKGWAEYEWRIQCDDYSSRQYKKPRWDGGDIAGKTILLYAEQGNGDTIHFIRYVEQVANLGAKVIVECQSPLIPLFERLDCIHQLVAKGDKLPSFDLHAPLMSLPYIFKTTIETIPAQVPYLCLSERAKISELLADRDLTNKLKVGIVWAGSETHLNDLNRSIELSSFLPFISDNVQLFSLQVGNREADLSQNEMGDKIINLAPHIKDYMDTASFIDQLDLVITVDTSVAHLAGALAKPVWVLIPYVPDWRWMLERSDSPWYPTMQLFRQSQIGQWNDVLSSIQGALTGFAK